MALEKERTSPVSNNIEFPEYLRDVDHLTEVEIQTRTPLYYAAANPEFELRQGHPGDAGFDLAVTEDFSVDAHDYGLIPCGVQMELPEGVFGWIVARSSTFQNWGFIVLPGVIDTGFRGELKAAVYNTQGTSVKVRKGDRVCQIVPLPNLADGIAPIRKTRIGAETSRGAAGFGSTGKN